MTSRHVSALDWRHRRNEAKEDVTYCLKDIAAWWKSRASDCLARGTKNYSVYTKQICECGKDEGMVYVELGRKKALNY